MPRCTVAVREAARREMRRRFDELTGDKSAMSGREACNQIAQEYDCTTRWVYKVMKMSATLAGPVIDTASNDAQFELF